MRADLTGRLVVAGRCVAVVRFRRVAVVVVAVAAMAGLGFTSVLGEE